MKKLALTLIAVWGLAAGQANAIPVHWTLESDDVIPLGGFTYDAATNIFSDVGILSLDIYTSAFNAAANDARLESYGVVFGTYLRLAFSSALSDAGGTIGFTGYEQGLLTWYGQARRSGEAVGEGRSQSVPEPGSLILIGTGLLGLVLLRRRRARI